MAKYYAGIGSRGTPQHILNIMGMVGRFLAQNGWTLRSGGAEGADEAFEKGCDAAKGEKEIYLPWPNYRNNPSKLHPGNYPFNDQEELFAQKFHPNWRKCTPAVRKLHMRNSRILLGMEPLHGIQVTPVKFVLCWTQGGQIIGGTGQALRIAEALADGGNGEFKVINLGAAKNTQQLEQMVQSLEAYKA